MSEMHAENADNNEEMFAGLVESLDNERQDDDVYAQFERARHEFYDSIAESVIEAYEEPLDRMVTLDVTEVAVSFEGVLKDVYVNSTSYDDFVDTLANVLADDAHTRAGFLNSTLHQYGLSMKYYDRETIDAQIRDTVTSSESPNLKGSLESLASMYIDDLSSDMGKFLQVMLEKAGGSHSDRGVIDDRDLSAPKTETLKKHAVDIAKIAAGVSIAFAVDRLLRRAVR